MTKHNTIPPFADSDTNTSTSDVLSSKNTNSDNSCSLKNHFLIAMPSLTDPYFEKSVVYLCQHDEDGATGFIVNYPVKLTVQELLENAESISHEPIPPIENPVFLGGPLDMDRGFVLHSPMKDSSHSTLLNEQLMMSNSNVVLSSLGTEKEPENYIVTLGYSSWDPGQLEDEINKNQWLTIDCETDTIFKTPVDKRWSSSLQRLGVDPLQLSNEIGHA